VSITVGLPFDCDLTSLRPCDDLRYYGEPTCVWGLLRCGLNKQAVRVATQYAPAPLPPWAPKRLARRRADATYQYFPTPKTFPR